MRHWHRNGSACRTMLVYSPGGHRRELELAVEDLGIGDLLCASFPPLQAITLKEAPRRTQLVALAHPRRRLGRLLVNAAQSVYWILRFRPCLIASSGADVAVPSIVLGKALFRRKTLFIESAGTLGPTLAGQLCRRSTDLLLAQWPEQVVAHPRAVLLPEPLL